MIKKIAIAVAVVLLLLIGVAITGLSLLGSFVTPDFLVKQIESNINARAEISKVNINLFSALSSVEVEGIKITTRDGLANSGTPQKDRSPLQGSLLSVDKAKLGLGLGSILRKELNLDELVLESPSIQLVMFESGGNNLTGLFKTPIIVDGNPNPKLSPEAIEARQKELEEEAKAKDGNQESTPFDIRSLPISLAMRELGIKNGNISINMKKTNQVIHLRGTNLLLKNLDVVPVDLTNHNSVVLNFQFNMVVIGSNKEESAGFQLSSGGKIQPFDPNSGQVNPNLNYIVKLHKGSFMSGFAVFDALAGGLPILKSLNIQTDKIAQRSELTQDVSTTLSYTKGRVTFKDSPSLPTKHYDLKITEGTWIQITNNTHEMKGKILASQEESNKAIAGLDKALETNAKGVDTTAIKKEITDKLLDKGRLALPFSSTGNLKTPQVTLGVELPSISGLLKGAATQAVKDAINKNVPKEAQDALKKFGF